MTHYKIPLSIIFVLTSVIGLFIFLGNSKTETDKAQDEFNQYYKIYSLALPKSISFAGTKIPLTEFDVAERYDREILTNVYWQSQTILMIKRANRYFPLIEKILKQNNIPTDFKYVALAESGLQNVVSPAGAAGFWQFMDKTGKRYYLEINEEVDERYQLEKATHAACLYFKEAYSYLGDWSLVAASYNMGILGVKRQIAAQGINNFFDLYLNTETSRYLFRIIAIKDIVENPLKYGFNVPLTDMYKPVATIKVRTDLTISDLAEWAKQNACNYKLLKLLNPWIRKPFLNVPLGKTYYVDLPKDRLMASALAIKIKNDTLQLSDTRLETLIKEDVIADLHHHVLKGETIRSIAKKYNVSEEDIVFWNELTPSEVLKAGTELKIKKMGEDD